MKKLFKKSILWLIIWILLSIMLLFASMALFAFTTQKSVTWSNMVFVLHKTKTKEILLITFILPILIKLMLLIFYKYVWKKPKVAADIKRANSDFYGLANFLANEKISPDLSIFEKQFTSNKNEMGWVVKSKFINNNTQSWISSCTKTGHHCLVIGATASGKTQKTILQSISHNAKIENLADKPSFVIFDPKGEIANNQAEFLMKNGYDIKIFNLRDTFKSSCWNPLFLANKLYFDAKLLEIEIEEKQSHFKNFRTEINNENVKELNLSYLNNLSESIKEKRNNKKLLSKDELFEIQNEIEKEIDRLEELKAKAIVKISNVDEIINDIGLALYNDPNSKEKFWQESAKSGFLAIYYLMLETIEEKYLNDKKYNEINKEKIIEAYSKINLPSIASVLTNLEDIKECFKLVQNLKYEELAIKYKMKKSYINGASIFLNDSGNTLGNIVATINTGLEQYKQSTMQNITTTNEIELDKIADSEKPVALFIIVPDEKENLYKFATLFVDQIYKANISLASTKREQKLPRPLMFFLDEFGNIPTIPKFETMITVSRSRNIFFCIAIQGFNQIDSKYGKDNANVIIENMLLHIYVSSTDQKTIQYYQKRAGTYTIYKTSISTNIQNETTKNSTSTNLDKKDLLNEDDIKNNPNDMLMIFYKNLNMSWIKTDPWWKCLDLHTQRIGYENLNKTRIFRFEEHYFNPLLFWLKESYEAIIEKYKYKENVKKYLDESTSPADKGNCLKRIKESKHFNENDILIIEKTKKKNEQKTKLDTPINSNNDEISQLIQSYHNN